MLGPMPLRSGTFVTVDIETTGGRPGANDIIEIGAVRICGGAVESTFSMLVRPRESVPPVVSELTGITDAALFDAPSVDAAIRAFAEFARDAVLVAHNHRFDLGFLDYEAERALGAPFSRPVLDTLSLARRLNPGLTHYNLKALGVLYSAPTEPNHRALPDAMATAEVFLAMIDDLTGRGLERAADAAAFCGLARQGGLSRKLALATHLPDGPGVYLFRDPTGAVVFVGRAKELRSRVRSHFYGSADPQGATHAAATHSIDYIACASRLDALLLESRLLDRYRPLFNRNRTPLKAPLYLHVNMSSPVPVFRVTHRRYRTGTVFGPLSNEWAARTLAAAIQSQFRLRACSRSDAECLARECRIRDTGVCEGAGEASTAEYAERVRAAIAMFDGDADRFRQSLNIRRESAVADERYEDAIGYRDAIRALDRTLGALAVAARAAAEGVSVLIEGDQYHLVLLVLVQGWLHTTIRLDRSQIQQGIHLPVLTRALQRAQSRSSLSLPVTPRRLRDILIIDGYRTEQRPVSVVISEDLDASIRQVDSVIRRTVRVPRKRHGAASIV